MTVVEHRAVDKPVGILGEVLEILIMGGHHAPKSEIDEAVEYRLCDRSSDLRLCAPSELVDEHQRSGSSVADDGLHVAQMRTVGRQIVLYRLVVADIHEDVGENAEMRIVVNRRKQSALQHVLQHSDRLQTHRLAARVGSRYHQQTRSGSQHNV